MNPKDYIKYRQSLWPERNFEGNAMSPSVAAMLEEEGYDIQRIAEVLKNDDFGLRMLEWLGSRVPEPVMSLFEAAQIVLGEVNDPYPNASVTKLGDEGYAILFNTGLKSFLYRVARAVATRIVLVGDNPLISFHETCRIIAEIFWWYSEAQQAYGPDYPISMSQIQFANFLTMEAESFLIAHEIGHILTEDAVNTSELNFSLYQMNEVLIIHKDEFESDAIGLAFMLNLYNNSEEAETNSGPPLDVSYAAVEFVFQTYRILELLGFEFSSTHPSAQARLDFIRTLARTVCADETDWNHLTNLANQIDHLFQGIFEVISNPEQHDAFFIEAATDIVRKLEKLLDHCAGGVVPDYVRFDSEAGDIFNQGYSYRLHETVANIAGYMFSNAARISKDSSKKDVDEYRRNFNKFKLLFHFMMEAPEPTRSVFFKALGVAGHNI